ncbi:MAG: TIGR02466 family protein [Pseudomonadota bacterium]
MTTIDTLFATRLYRARLAKRNVAALNARLRAVADALQVDDSAGIAWCERNAYPGYTSYGSLNDLPWRFPECAELRDKLDGHAQAFGEALEFDLGNSILVLDSLWVNVLEPGGHHAAHIHPHSVISGTYYVDVPKGAGAIRFEDPRHAMMMAAPPRRASAAADNRSFVTVAPKPGDVLLWESWLRHDVPIHTGDEVRVSISFNYGLEAAT